MTAKSKVKNIRISPFKVRRVANEIRYMNVVQAQAYLKSMTNKGAHALYKAVHSASSNLVNMDKSLDDQSFTISNILIDGGPTYKRFHPISRGRASKILKRTSHITVEVSSL